MVDRLYRTRSLGVAAEGIPDQYSDGRAAKVWEFYIGSKQSRTDIYCEWLTTILKKHNCHSVLDVACGTGVDSIMLLENGFKVTSTDASDKMLKYALRERWNRRKDPTFDHWTIEEANWLTLVDDLACSHDNQPLDQSYDAVLCLGNSFAHLPDVEGNQASQKVALSNFYAMVKPGGILMVDHRNYDAILERGIVPKKNVYYNSEHVVEIKCSNLTVNGRPTMVTLDYLMDMSVLVKEGQEARARKFRVDPENCMQQFRLSYYPHKLDEFTDLLKETLGECKHDVYGDFVSLEAITNPSNYIHVIEKPL